MGAHSESAKKNKYLRIRTEKLKLDLEDIGELTECREHKYPCVNFNESGTDTREIEGKIVQARRANLSRNSYCGVNK